MECNSNCESDADGVDDSYNVCQPIHLYTGAVIAHNNTTTQMHNNWLYSAIIVANRANNSILALTKVEQ